MEKVLILSNYGMGLYKFRRELISTLCNQYQVTICIPQGEYDQKLQNLGATVVHCEMERRGMNPLHELTLLNRYRKVLKAEKPDVVLTYTIKPNVYGGMICGLKKIPYLPNVTGLGTTIENGGLMSKLSLTLYKMGLRKASCVFFQNAVNRDLFLNRKVYTGKSKVIPGSGVNLNDHPFEDYPELDKEYRFLFIGRIMKDKGIDELLYATTALHNEGINIQLDIVGEFDEDYESILKDAEKNGYIHFRGLQNNVHPFIKASHCVVLPSYHEGMANVMLEAASTGRPVITTTVPGCRETFEEGITGFGCEAKNGESLLAAMRKFTQLSRDKMAEMGKQGRTKVENEFDRNIVINVYRQEIETILKH